MAGELPSNVGEGPIAHPPAGPWTPNHPMELASRPRSGRAAALAALGLAAIAVVLAAVALFVTITHSSGRVTSSVVTSTPTGMGAETSAAQHQLCETYRLAARAVQVDTNGTDLALGRVAATNGAAMLDSAAANPALDPAHRDAARALATAYRTTTAMATTGVVTDTEWRAALDDVNAKDAAMKKLCSGS